MQEKNFDILMFLYILLGRFMVLLQENISLAMINFKLKRVIVFVGWAILLNFILLDFGLSSSEGGEQVASESSEDLENSAGDGASEVKEEIQAEKVTVNKSGWHIVKHKGRSYVRFSDIKKFYGFKSMHKSGGSLFLKGLGLSIKVQLGTNKMLINNVQFIASFASINSSYGYLVSVIDLVKLIDPIVRPAKIKFAKVPRAVVIDPGHGGADSGAKGLLGIEKVYTLKIARLLKENLKRYGLYPIMTRNIDKSLKLDQRIRVSNSTRYAIFISIHCNSHSNRSAKGIETFTMTPQGSMSTFQGTSRRDLAKYEGNLQDSQNIILATAIHSAVMGRISASDRGIRRGRYRVLTGAKRPAVLIECGFLTNPTDAKMIDTAEFQHKIADSIAIGIHNYCRALGAKNAELNENPRLPFIIAAEQNKVNKKPVFWNFTNTISYTASSKFF